MLPTVTLRANEGPLLTAPTAWSIHSISNCKSIIFEYSTVNRFAWRRLQLQSTSRSPVLQELFAGRNCSADVQSMPVAVGLT